MIFTPIPPNETHAFEIAVASVFLSAIKQLLLLRDYDYNPIPGRERCIEDEEVDQFEPILEGLSNFIETQVKLANPDRQQDRELIFDYVSLLFGNSYLLNKLNLNAGSTPYAIKLLKRTNPTEEEFSRVLEESEELCLALYDSNEELWQLQEADIMSCWKEANEK